MKRTILLVLASGVLGLASWVLTQDAQPRTQNPFQTEYEQMLYPTVRVTAGMATGSGVIIDYRFRIADTKISNQKSTIYILSAAHVVGNESTVVVEFFSSSVLQSATVVITDTAKDLALIQLRNVNCELRIYTTKLADKNYRPYLFTPVWAVGCSLGLPPRPSYGHLCAFAVNNWEISAPILPGNSGGPVYDAKTYEVIGIAVWVRTYQFQLVTTMAGIVPIQTIYEFLQNYERTKELKNERNK